MSMFHEINRNRKAAAQASRKFHVTSLTKAGVPAKFPPTKFDSFQTREEAEACQARMSVNNPGRTWVIVEL
jgi:hypothetical protein